MAIKTASTVGIFFIVVLFAVAMAAAGAIWSEQLPDGGVQWLRCSPGHAGSGDAACIASTPLHGHRNGLQRRCIHSLLPPLLSDQIIAKRPCYDPFKLPLSYDINLIYVISLFICY